MSWRRLGVLIRQLPVGSRTRLAVVGEEWTTLEHLAAITADATRGANWQRTGKKSGQPKPIPRPGDVPEKTETKSWGKAVPIDEAKRIFDEWDKGGD